MEPGHIGIVTVTFNSHVMLNDFLDSLRAQTYKQFTLYAVDNVSTDRTLEILGECTNLDVVVLANTENVGIAEGSNQGIRRAFADGCDEILLLNNDVIFEPTMIEELHNGLELHQCDMTTGKMYYFDRPDVIWAAGGNFQSWPRFEIYHIGVDQEDKGQFDQDCRVGYAPTTLILARMTVFERVGLLDAQYFVSYEDTDFMLRCKRAGMSLWYIPAARLWHKVGSISAPRQEYVEYLFSRNRVYFSRKHVSRQLSEFWYAMDSVRFLVSRLIGRSSASMWRNRRKGMMEGRTMVVPAAEQPLGG